MQKDNLTRFTYQMMDDTTFKMANCLLRHIYTSGQKCMLEVSGTKFNILLYLTKDQIEDTDYVLQLGIGIGIAEMRIQEQSMLYVPNPQ